MQRNRSEGRKWLLFFLAVGSCASPPSSLGPAPEAAVGDVFAACQGWVVEGEDRTLLLDLYAGRRPHEPLDAPSERVLAGVRAAGGEVVHSFCLPVARVRIGLGRLPELRAYANHARTVPYPNRHYVRLIVTFGSEPEPTEVAAVEALGARVLSRGRTSLLLEVDDAAIPHIRALPGVWVIEGEGIACVGP